MYCKYCGGKTSDKAEFCEKCGKPTKKAESGASVLSTPMILNIVTLCVLVLYIVLMFTTWYTLEISFGYGMGEDYSVGMLSAMECWDLMSEVKSDWGYLFGNDMEAVFNVLAITPAIMFFVSIAELIIAVVNIFILISKMRRNRNVFHPCVWHWLDVVPITAIFIPIALGQIIGTNTERMFDMSASSAMYIMLTVCVAAEFVLNMFIGSKYTVKNASQSWVNDAASKTLGEGSARDILTKPISFKKSEGCGDDQWECTSCGRRFTLDVLKCSTCNLKKEDCIAQMEREKRKKK